MTQTKHTPGPWHVVPYGDGNALVICTEPDGDWRICFLATPGDSSGAWETIKSDARLISAAPEMLEALRGCISYRNWQIAEGGLVPPELVDVWKRAEAALSKAGGQADVE